MESQMLIAPHSQAWYERMAQMHGGYHFTWQSNVAPHNGEDVYLELAHTHLSPQKDVLDAGCGHGDFTLALASACRSIWAYDRVEAFIRIAKKSACQRNIQNITFVCADAGVGGRGHIPVPDDSFDVLLSRRGDLKWIEDAKRIGRPGAVLLQLNPWQNPAGIPPWNEELPEVLRFAKHDFDMREIVEQRLKNAGLELHSCWTFDVPECFTRPEQLYARLVWGFASNEVPSWEALQPLVERIYAAYATKEGIVLRQRRFLWQAVVDK